MEHDLDGMSRDDLMKLKKEVDKAIRTFDDRKKQEALAEMQEVARKHGVDLNEIVAGKKKGSVSAPKYRHPENASLTWAGKGRKPKWLNEQLADGASIDDFRI
jgi:DNA-binding protein H-NS